MRVIRRKVATDWREDSGLIIGNGARQRVSGHASRTASSIRVTPTPVNSAVSVGWIQDTATKLIAARL